MSVAEIIDYPQSLSDWVTTARSGIPKRVLDELAGMLGVKVADLAPQLHVSARTLNRYGADQLLPADLSERILIILRTYERAREVFGDPAKASAWLNRPNRVLGGQTPLDLLDTIFGAEQVMNLLGRIEHGVYS
ncbi:type II RES/Xre toxin-antitoxin system antitoxin [Geoalkalibacter subterraneus]|jgi:putative toxin-antitoxin system antitoxin component (TIGR02293 family)|uniref:type II RES/Xre toxin-antitoxin system antitoxin n=1 Tax=Geoalkalibacter subterraneus TaxID=483547 RepID=UPI000693F5B0|nr:antitoxin Xre/MbcA/ParS toxin-binding domain-containing protein [Geoalkalibacter subterraneus]